MDSPKATKTQNGDIVQKRRLFGISKPTFHSRFEQKPRLLLMGLKRYSNHPAVKASNRLHIYRSGKTSISNVVFRKMTPSDTIFLDTTTTIQKDATQ